MDARFFLSTATLALALSAMPAAAQTAPAAAPDGATPAQADSTAQASTGEQGLQEIVVTAQRRSENLQRAAIAVSVVSSDALARLNVTQSSQLTTLVPALQVASSGSSNLFYLRGVGTFAVNSFSDPAIAFNYDGVYVGRPSATTGVFYDVERVEVLKGPQGTLYGRNATGGAINILPARPKLEANSGDFSATLGNYNTVVLQGDVNLVLSDKAALRVAGIYSKHDGYLSDGTNDEDGKGARAQLLYRPTSDLSIRIAGDYYKAGGVGGSAALVGVRNPFTGAITPASTDRGTGLYDPQVQALFPQQYSFQLGRTLRPLSPTPAQDSEFWGVNAELSWSTAAGTLTVIPAYRRADVHSLNAVTSFISLFDEKTTQKSVEARFASPDTGFFRYLVGAFYYREESQTADVFAQQTLTNYLGGALDTTSYAAFGRVTLAFTDKFRLSGGLRYTNDRKSVDGASQTLVAVCVAASCPGGLVLPYAQTPAGLISTLGLVGPLPSPVPAFGSIYVNPSSPTSILGNNRSVLNMEQKNSRVTWRAGAKYTDFRYTTPAPPPTRCLVTPPAPGSASSTVDCSGLRALRSPEWTMNFGLRQTIPLGTSKIVLQGEARYQSSSYVGFELLDIQQQAAYWTGQASATFSPESEKWSAAVFVNNIGNQRPWGDIVYNGNANLFAGSPGAPRLYGVRFSVKY